MLLLSKISAEYCKAVPLLKSQRLSNEFIAEKLDITVPTVRLCLQKFMESVLPAKNQPLLALPPNYGILPA